MLDVKKLIAHENRIRNRTIQNSQAPEMKTKTILIQKVGSIQF